MIRVIFLIAFVGLFFVTSCSPSLKISEYAVTENSLFLNNTVASLPLQKYDVKLLRIRRNGRNLKFTEKTKILLRDTLYLLGTSNQLEKIYRYFDKKD